MKRVTLLVIFSVIFISCSGYNAVINHWSLIRGIDLEKNDFFYSGIFADTIRAESKTTLFKHNADIYDLNDKIEQIIDDGKIFPELKIDSSFCLSFNNEEITFYMVNYNIGKSVQTLYYTESFGVVLRIFSQGKGIGLVQVSRAGTSDTSRIDIKPLLRDFIDSGIIKN